MKKIKSMNPVDLLSIDEQIREMEVKENFEKIGGKIYKKQPEEWKENGLKIRWNLCSDDFFYSFDSYKDLDSFNADYPNGLLLGKAFVQDIYTNLHESNRIYDLKTFRKCCNPSKAQALLGRWCEGYTVTPPYICINKFNDLELILSQGNHRFNISYLSKEAEIYFLAVSSEKQKIEKILESIKWE